MARRIRRPRVRVYKNTRTEVMETRRTRTAAKWLAIETELDDMEHDVEEALKGHYR